jgi:hypothetical protein
MSEQERDEHLKKCLSIIDNWVEKNKPPTLYQIIHDNLGYSHECTQEIIDAVERWLPKESSRPSYSTMQWDKCVKLMKEKLQ